MPQSALETLDTVQPQPKRSALETLGDGDVFDQAAKTAQPTTSNTSGDLFDQAASGSYLDTLDTVQPESQTGSKYQPMVDEVRRTFTPDNAAKSMQLALSGAGTSTVLKGAAGVGEKALQASENALATFKTSYPHLSALAGKLGYAAGTAGVLEFLGHVINGKKD